MDSALLVLAGLLGAGLALAGFGIRALAAGLRTRGWPGVEGGIVRSGPGDGAPRDPASTGYASGVAGRYEVAGRTCTGTRSDTAGSRVAVFHHPADPARSVLRTGAGRRALNPAPRGRTFLPSRTSKSRHLAVPRRVEGGDAGRGSCSIPRATRAPEHTIPHGRPSCRFADCSPPSPPCWPAPPWPPARRPRAPRPRREVPRR